MKETVKYQQNEAYMIVGAFKGVSNLAVVAKPFETLAQPAYEEVMDIISTRGKEKPPEYEEIIL